MNWKLLNIIFILFCFYSCKKEKDIVKPTITVTSPVYLQQINGTDTIQVLATVSDDRNIESVTVSLRDGNDISVLSTLTKSPDKKKYQLNVAYFFDDINLPSGQYIFKISAFDGENVSTEYVEITYNETTKIRNGIFVISNIGSVSDVYLLDNNYNGSFYHSFSGDFLGADVNSYHQQLIFSSSITGSLSSIDLLSGNILWNIPIISSPPTPYYKGFLCDNQHIYMGKRSGEIQGYDKNGAANYYTQANVGYYMESALVHNNYYLVTEQQLIAGSTVKLVLYWLASGVEAQQISINKDIKGIYSQTVNTLILLTNDATLNGKLVFYDIPTGLTSSPFAINVGKIDDCVEISAGLYLVAEAGNITLINANNFSKLPYLTGVGADKIWYDATTNDLFVASGNLLSVYDYPSKVLKGNYTHPSTILDVVFWYNK